MTPTEVTAILRKFNDWRRGADIPQPDPREIGEAIDAAVEMIDRLEAAEKERESWKGVAQQFGNDADELRTHLSFAKDELNRLRVKIEGMENQEPVAWCATDETGTVIEALGMNQSRRFDTALYLAPGAQAQPAPSMPDLLESLRCACNYIDKLGGVSQQYRAMLAAAPEAKP